MKADVRRIVLRLMVFMIPLAVYAGGIALVDPYNYFSESSPLGGEAKPVISFKLNYAMWKILDFRRHPGPDILLGDSRMMSLDTDLIAEVSGQEYSNLAYGGGSLREAIDTFWLAADLTELRQVVIGVNLNNFNDNDRKDRVAEVRAALHNPLIYLVNRNVVKAAGGILRQELTGTNAGLGNPDMSRSEFWRHQIEVTTRGYYANYAYPKRYLAELAEVSAFCRRKSIGLKFVIFPSHRDLRDQAARYGLEEAAASMPLELAKMGVVYNFELDNALTRDESNFKDPYHLNEVATRLIIDGVWGDDQRYVRISGPTAAATTEAENP